jgi:hypothetical protein
MRSQALGHSNNHPPDRLNHVGRALVVASARADKQPFFLAVDYNSIVNVKEMSNDLLGTRSFYANLNEIDLSSHA